jgi:hypothetical protein
MQPPQKPPEGHVPSVFSTPWEATGQSLGKWGLWVSVFLSFFGEKGKEKQGRNNILFPLPRASRGRRRPTMSFKTTPFGSFFLMTSG